MNAPTVPVFYEVVGDYLGKTLTPEVAAELCAKVTARCYPGPVDTTLIFPKRVGSYLLRTARVTEVIDDLREIHWQHWQETEGYRHGIEFNPDYERGLDFEAQGRYVLVVAEHIPTGKIVGNYGLYLNRSMHTQTIKASEDTLFVSREHRRGRLGIEIMRYAERAVAQLGAQELDVSVKLVNKVGPMLERMGYAPVGTQYVKILKEDANVH